MAIDSLLFKRVDHRPWGTYGVFIGPLGPICCALERPYTDGFGKLSYIKAGVYPWKLTPSPKFKAVTPELFDVAGRSKIRIHWGNDIHDTEGCILTGTTFDPVGGMNGKVGVAGSKLAFDELMDLPLAASGVLTVSDF